MATIAELGAKLLEDAAGFFRSIGDQNINLREQMTENATVFEQMGSLLRDDPLANLGEFPHHELAARLLGDAAGFFRTIGDQNEAIKNQMYENADVYAQLADHLRNEPLKDLEVDGDNKLEIRINTPPLDKDGQSLKDTFNKK